MTGELRALWSGHPPQVLATALPLLVMDMYKHSYQMHYGAGALKYIDAFSVNIQWNAVNRRLERAQAVRRTLAN
jgi:Fe-Mn family superoxide dismutase